MVALWQGMPLAHGSPRPSSTRTACCSQDAHSPMNSRELEAQSLVTLHNRARNKRPHKTKPITASQRQTTAAGRRRIPNLDEQKPSRNKQDKCGKPRAGCAQLRLSPPPIKIIQPFAEYAMPPQGHTLQRNIPVKRAFEHTARRRATVGVCASRPRGCGTWQERRLRVANFVEGDGTGYDCKKPRSPTIQNGSAGTLAHPLQPRRRGPPAAALYKRRPRLALQRHVCT